MDEREVIIEEMADGHRMLDAAMSDLTSEIADWQPGGTANSIASILAHTVIVEDEVVKQWFQGGKTLFENAGWSSKTGIPNDMEAIWKPGWSLNFAGFDAYREAVKQSSDQFLAELDPATLDLDIEAFGAPRRGGWLLRIEAPNHILSHLGEISVLRGIKGLAGLPI